MSVVAGGELCSAGTVKQGLRIENVLIRRVFFRCFSSRSSLVWSGGNSMSCRRMGEVNNRSSFLGSSNIGRARIY